MTTRRNRRIEFIPAIVSPNHKNVAIYCRVSTSNETQENSLDNQVKGLTEIVRQNEDWTLVRIYEDIQSGANTFRPNFESMMRDAYDHDFDLILVKSISRFSRNLVDFLTTINTLNALQIEVEFDKENIKSTDPKQRLMMEVKGIFAQAESQAISKNIKLGQHYLMKSGKSKLYRRKCYGYKHNEYGELAINEEESIIVSKIFERYVEGYSVNKIIKELAMSGVKSPKGSDKWPKRTIQHMLVNEKYIGNVLLGKTCTGEFPNNKQMINQGQVERFLMEEGHTPLISNELFEKVQAEIKRRSNIEIVDGKVQRKDTHYSAKDIIQ